MLRYLRSLPRRAPRPAVFLDRDGVLNRRQPDGYVTRPEQFELLPGALDAARAAQRAGAALVVVTNQGAIGRQLASEADVEAIHRLLIDALERADVAIDAIYVCPHHPLALDETQRRCGCRKPKPGLINQAVRDLNLDLRRSTLIGDQLSDIEAARAAGIARPVLFTPSGANDDLVRTVLAAIGTTRQRFTSAAGWAR
jgi:D-glycero-D-manno-heptose 1,7-bisphosphate phosphatase